MSELLNRRAPAAWLAVSQEGGSDADLLQLAHDCATLSTILVLPGPTFDLVMVPRTACRGDGVAFAVFATRVGAGAAVGALPSWFSSSCASAHAAF